MKTPGDSSESEEKEGPSGSSQDDTLHSGEFIIVCIHFVFEQLVHWFGLLIRVVWLDSIICAYH